MALCHVAVDLLPLASLPTATPENKAVGPAQYLDVKAKGACDPKPRGGPNIPADQTGGEGRIVLSAARAYRGKCLPCEIEVETVQVSIIGASRATGLEASSQALAAGHHVPALARSVSEIGFRI